MPLLPLWAFMACCKAKFILLDQQISAVNTPSEEQV
jgi:hypothetical protein